jgi:hypothetical protein
VLNEKYKVGSTISIEDKSNLTPKNGTGTIVTIRIPIKRSIYDTSLRTILVDDEPRVESMESYWK